MAEKIAEATDSLRKLAELGCQWGSIPARMWERIERENRIPAWANAAASTISLAPELVADAPDLARAVEMAWPALRRPLCLADGVVLPTLTEALDTKNDRIVVDLVQRLLHIDAARRWSDAKKRACEAERGLHARIALPSGGELRSYAPSTPGEASRAVLSGLVFCGYPLREGRTKADADTLRRLSGRTLAEGMGEEEIQELGAIAKALHERARAAAEELEENGHAELLEPDSVKRITIFDARAGFLLVEHVLDLGQRLAANGDARRRRLLTLGWLSLYASLPIDRWAARARSALQNVRDIFEGDGVHALLISLTRRPGRASDVPALEDAVAAVPIAAVTLAGRDDVASAQCQRLDAATCRVTPGLLIAEDAVLLDDTGKDILLRGDVLRYGNGRSCDPERRPTVKTASKMGLALVALRDGLTARLSRSEASRLNEAIKRFGITLKERADGTLQLVSLNPRKPVRLVRATPAS